jgi:hypothetical protein
MRCFLLGLAAAAVALVATCPALANGRFPASNQIIFSPTDESTIIGRATYAILPSTDNGKSWGYLCEDALALPGSKSFQDPEIGVTYNNSIIAGLYAPTKGLDVSNDLGCNWNCIGGPLAGQQIADIVVRPDLGPDAGSTSHQVLALTSTFVDAGIASQVFESPDDGVTWTALGPPLDPTVAFATIDVAPSDPSRIYLSGNRNFALARTGSLFASTDNGKTWTEYPVPSFNALIPCSDMQSIQCQSEDTLYIAGVDPTDENRVYLRSDGPTNTGTPGNSNLYVTTDGGKTFQIAKSFALPPPNTDFLVSGELLGFALSVDGSKVFIGTKETGLWSASKTDLNFSIVNAKIGVQCLATRQASTGPELWACASEPFGGFIFGKSTDDGVTFQPMMATVTSMSGLIACSPTGGSAACLTDANASSCTCSDYQQFCSITEAPNACLGCGQDGGGPPPSEDDSGDAGGPGGVTDGSAEGGPGKAATSPNASCGCSVVGGGSAAGFFAGWAILAIAVRRRRAR